MASDGRRDGWLFATLAAIAIVTAVVSSLGAPLVPSVAAEYDVSVSTAQWVLTATMIAAAASTPVIGRWGSGRLRRPVILGSLGLVLGGLVLSALPTGFGVLLFGRSLQGVGLALAPLTLAVARDVWSGERLLSRLSLLSVATVAGAGLGYPLTSLMAQVAGLPAAYGTGTALVAATLALAVRHLPRHADGEPQAVDLPGAGLVGVGMAAVLLAVSQGEAWGWTSAVVLGLASAGVLTLLGWTLRSLRVARRGGQPLVDLRLATRHGVVGPNLVAFLLAVAMYGLLTVVVLLVRADGSDGWGLDRGVLLAGIALVPYSLMSVLGSRVAIRVSRSIGPGALLPTGCAVFAAAMALLAFAHDELWQVLAAMAIGGLGSGFSFSSMAVLIVPHVPPAETGSALAFNQLLRYLGFAVGSTVSVALLAAYGGDDAALRRTSLTLAALCVAAGLVSRWRRLSGVPAGAVARRSRCTDPSSSIE